MSGIFRDVYILRRAKERIVDYKITQSIDFSAKEGNLDLEILSNIGNPKGKYLLNPNNHMIASGNIDNNKVQINIKNVELWSAEIPNLYTLLIETEHEVIKEK